MASSNLKETEVNSLDPFGIPHRECNSVDLSNPFVDTWELVLDTSTGETKAVKGDPINFVEQIQTFKDQCGIEAMRRDIAAGRALPGDFADDGKSGGDFTRSTMISEYVDQLVSAKLEAEKANSAAKDKGIDVDTIVKDGVDVESYIKDLVDKRLAAANVKNDGGLEK